MRKITKFFKDTTNVGGFRLQEFASQGELDEYIGK